MDSNKKPTKKLIVLLGGGILMICLCLAVIVIAFTPSDEEIKQETEVSRVVAQDIESGTTIESEIEEQTASKTTESSHTPSPTRTPAPSRTPAPTRTPTQTPDPNLVEPGMYLINVDIKPGIYRGLGSCYWERLKDASGTFDAIIANGNTENQFYVQINESDFAFSINCKMVYLDTLPEPKEEFPQLYNAGMYLVGIDLLPGIYRGDGSCYWERLKDASGTFDAIIANGNTENQFYVHINESDFAFSINCEMVPLETLSEPTGELPQKFEPGMYLVGRDMLPGTYQGNGSCYWERLRNVSGSFDAIIANGNTDGQFYVQVSEGDFAFSTGCEVERVGD
jgi:hypothetical protein